MENQKIFAVILILFVILMGVFIWNFFSALEVSITNVEYFISSSSQAPDQIRFLIQNNGWIDVYDVKIKVTLIMPIGNLKSLSVKSSEFVVRNLWSRTRMQIYKAAEDETLEEKLDSVVYIVSSGPSIVAYSSSNEPSSIILVDFKVEPFNGILYVKYVSKNFYKEQVDGLTVCHLGNNTNADYIEIAFRDGYVTSEDPKRLYDKISELSDYDPFVVFYFEEEELYFPEGNITQIVKEGYASVESIKAKEVKEITVNLLLSMEEFWKPYGLRVRYGMAGCGGESWGSREIEGHFDFIDTRWKYIEIPYTIEVTWQWGTRIFNGTLTPSQIYSVPS